MTDFLYGCAPLLSRRWALLQVYRLNDISAIRAVPSPYHVQAGTTVSQPDALKEVFETRLKPPIRKRAADRLPLT